MRKRKEVGIIELLTDAFRKRDQMQSKAEWEAISGIDPKTNAAVRPLTFDDFIGQDALKDSLRKIVSFSRSHDQRIPHLLFTGTPGVGKTTLANIMANERGVKFVSTFANTIKSPYELYKLIVELEPLTVLFLDEIHAIKPSVSEALYYAMEDGKISYIDEDYDGLPTTSTIPSFSLIAATTMPGNLERPLFDRFSRAIYVPEYTHEDLTLMIKETLKSKGYSVAAPGLDIIAKASRATPRIIMKIAKYLEEFMFFEGGKHITKSNVINCLKKEKIHPVGLDPMDIRYLNAVSKAGDKGAGLKTLTSVLMTNRKTVENAIEPFLLKNNFIEVTAKGRKLTAEGSIALNATF